MLVSKANREDTDQTALEAVCPVYIGVCVGDCSGLMFNK